MAVLGKPAAAKARPKAKVKANGVQRTLHKRPAGVLHTLPRRPAAAESEDKDDSDSGITANDRRQFKIALGSSGVSQAILNDWTDVNNLGYGKGKREKINCRIQAWKDPSE
eukprot:7846713-Pyramimonas_sp.AAC.1